jgi:hypothetical protein
MTAFMLLLGAAALSATAALLSLGAAADASEGALEVSALVELAVSELFEQPAASIPVSAPTAISVASFFNCLPLKDDNDAVSRMFIRFAARRDLPRIIADGVLPRETAAGQATLTQTEAWMDEQALRHRFLLVAEDHDGIHGIAQVIFRLPGGMVDPERCNGTTIALVDPLRSAPDAPRELAAELLAAAEGIARKEGVRFLTLCVPMDDKPALTLAASWGFGTFRLVTADGRTHGYLRKELR